MCQLKFYKEKGNKNEKKNIIKEVSIEKIKGVMRGLSPQFHYSTFKIICKEKSAEALRNTEDAKIMSRLSTLLL